MVGRRESVGRREWRHCLLARRLLTALTLSEIFLLAGNQCKGVLPTGEAFVDGRATLPDLGRALDGNFQAPGRRQSAWQCSRHAADAAGAGGASPVKRSRLVQVWGALGVAAYLSYGVKKVVPIVREGVAAITSPLQWCFLVATVVFFAYYEGYKGFQLGFSPRVVSRAWVVSEQFGEDREAGAAAPAWHKVLAPAFCIGYFHGTRKRVIASWCVTATIFCVVIGVRRLPNPYRAIIDAGVIVGLLWGTSSVLAIFVRSLRDGKPPDYDPSLPESTPYHSPT
eukprot:TRINITY_DN107817_c0_g1_i1.p1 TRINITY_DN107817_c0_g1~~TRINITY_DN107817_c0_g1_i1.p1  ORF type:complete len:282 (+),score=42.44 TRINITY_DN107817_c0_g1_i1:61-906(+)